jgi:phosphoribosylamine--glycine ligase
MNILIIGSGGREHALSWKIAQSDQCDELYISPGNAGTDEIGTNVAINLGILEEIDTFIQDRKIGMVVIGPEDPLVNGLADHLLTFHQKLLVVGPKAKAAQLEGSKDFAKRFMKEHGIPTARYESFTSGQIENAKEYLKSFNPPFVLKADGLAAGKGVLICQSLEEAEEGLEEMLVEKKFGMASERVVIEEFLKGIEVSFFVLTDGTDYILLPEAKDYKRIGDGDTGPNTGGMGAVSPVSFVDNTFKTKVIDRIIEPTIKGLKKQSIDYCGFIFFGLMNVGGDPYVIEYNVRLGDPETQVILPRLQTDLVGLMRSAASRQLKNQEVHISENSFVTVVGVSKGYPGNYEKEKVIKLVDEEESAIIFHAGTKKSDSGIVTSGGRVLAVSGFGNTKETALNNAYATMHKISWEGMSFRSDIGLDV